MTLKTFSFPMPSEKYSTLKNYFTYGKMFYIKIKQSLKYIVLQCDSILLFYTSYYVATYVIVT